MSGDSIPYQLRPNKFIDRELFVELVARLVLPLGPDLYAYLSMGGKHLRDHYSMYRKAGISNLFSFDIDDGIVRRQRFNRPLDATLCETMPSASVPTKLDTIDSVFPGIKNVVVWLDYTDPNGRFAQLQELIEVAKRASVGDVLRITLNASNANLDGDPKLALWRASRFRSPGTYRRSRLRSQIGDLLPSSIRTLNEHELPIALSRSCGIAFSRAEVTNTAVTFVPLLVTSYQDGQRMLTVTALAVERDRKVGSVPHVANWPFRSRSWSDCLTIEAPDLSLREKYAIDQQLHSAPDAILTALGFPIASSEEKSKSAIASYQRLHRHYPAFQHIEM